MRYCIEYSIKDFKNMLSKVTNDGVTVIFDEDGWNYGSTEEFGDVTKEIVKELIEKEIQHPVYNIYIDVTSSVVIIITNI